MKVEIDISGMLTIEAENGLEAYALKKWSEDNTTKSRPNLIVSYSSAPTDKDAKCMPPEAV